MQNFQRLSIWLCLFIALLLLATACSEPAPTPAIIPTSAPVATTAAPSSESTAAVPTIDSNAVQLFSWWTSGAEQNALDAMIQIYEREYPGSKVSNLAVNSGAVFDAFTELQQRLQRQDPPDTWQVHAGKESLGFVNAGQLEPLTQFFHEQGFDKTMPPLLLEQLKIKGEIYTVPLNIHRSNLLWYNPKVFKENNLTPPRTFDEFFEVAKKFQAKGIPALAISKLDGFSVAQLFESILLATFGPEDYLKLMQGDAALWADSRRDKSIQTLKEMLQYASPDSTAIGWPDAAERVLKGQEGMFLSGDWAEGHFKSLGAKPNEDFAWASTPGTDGVFMWLSDSFGLAKGAPHREQMLDLLKVMGSKEGQDAFNPLKGSIPARTDADTSLYDEYLQWSLAEFKRNKLAPSIVHGAAAPEAYMFAFGKALNNFATDNDAEALKQALLEAVVQLEE